jgi:phage terminase Nu1 subunit (DNA packaging protein)
MYRDKLEGHADQLLGRSELAAMLRVHVRTLDRWNAVRCGPPRVLVGGRVRYRLAAVRAWLIAREA